MTRTAEIFDSVNTILLKKLPDILAKGGTFLIYVVDAIMGTGKTSAAINYMNTHPDRRYMFVTPYLEEAKRVVDGCDKLKFVEPSDQRRDTNYSKLCDLKALVDNGINVAMSHELYSRITPEIIDIVRMGGYTVFIDEVVDVFRQPDDNPNDIEILVKAGYLVPDDEMSNDDFSVYRQGVDKYEGNVFRDLFRLANSRRLIGRNNAAISDKYYCWLLNRDLFDAAVDTYVLTYMFEGSAMHGYFKLNGLAYKSIGVEHVGKKYAFAEAGGTYEKAAHIREYINVIEHKMNAVGDKPGSLSMHWYETQRYADGENGIEQLRKNMYNYFMRVCKCDASDRLWTTYKMYETDVRGKFFKKGFVSWNARATNKYGHTHVLAFLANIYAHPSLLRFMKSKGVYYDQDKYALSCLVQWIWRSAIRNGEKVTLYLPSSRMRKLLNEWMDDLENGGDGTGFADKDAPLAS